MPKQFTNWLDEFVENGADKNNVPDWSTQSGGGGSYTPGNGINIVGNEISVDTQTIATKEDLNDYEPAEEAFSGDYNDLTNKPELATVATTGSYDDLTNQPTITNVEANSGEPTTATLNTLTVGDTVYSIPGGGSGSEYSAGDGISIDEYNVISANIYGDNDAIDVNHGCDGELEISLNDNYKVIANSGDDPTTSLSTLTVGDTVYSVPDAVSGEYDGTNWTSLTIGENTYNIPDAVSGTNDGNNWTTLTIGDDTYNIPTSNEDSIIVVDCSSTHTVTFTNLSTPGIYKITQKYSLYNNITIQLLAASSSRVLATISIPGYVASPDGDACMYLIWTESYPNNNQYNQRGLYGFYNYGGPTILYGYVNYVANDGAGSGYIEAKPITDFVNRDLISYKLRLTFTKDSADSYMDFIFSNENRIEDIDVATFKTLFDTTEPLAGDKKLCDINHTVRIYNNSTYTIGDIYYDSTTNTFGTVDGTITGLTLSSIVETEKSHTLPS